MNTCSKCNKQPSLPPAALEIINQCDPVLFHKVIYPAALGDDTTAPPDTLNYKNVLLVYEANEHAYLYSSDGAATFISMAAVDLTAIKEELAQHGIDIDNLKTEVATIQGDVETLQNSLAEETQNRQDADENLQDQITTNTQTISSLNTTVTSQGEQITNLETNLQDTTTELQTDIANETLARTEADDTLQSNIDSINTNLNQEVEKETDFTTDTSTVTVQHTKVNLSNNDTNITVDPLPVASETQAGVMNTATYQAIQNNAENVDAILNGAIALNGIAATPTQEELTTAWETATGRTALINRASIWDLDNEKVWYYYENINEWKSIPVNPEGEQVTVSTFTNTTPGIIKGSEEDGQLFAEADGTGSVVGWDGVKHDVENIVELLETNPIPKLYSSFTSATDGANTASLIKNALKGTVLALGENATNSIYNQGGITIGYNAKGASTATQSQGANVTIGSGANTYKRYSVAIGTGATVTGESGVAVGPTTSANQQSVAIGDKAKATSPYSTAIGASSATTRELETSIGSVFRTTFLANVRAGELDTDAVNVKQMKDYVAENTGLVVATPSVDNDGVLVISPISGVSNPQLGTTVLLKTATKLPIFNDPTNYTSYPYAQGGAALQLKYADGMAYPMKQQSLSDTGVPTLSNFTALASNQDLLLSFNGEAWVHIPIPIHNLTTDNFSPTAFMTPAEFNAAWEAA